MTRDAMTALNQEVVQRIAADMHTLLVLLCVCFSARLWHLSESKAFV